MDSPTTTLSHDERVSLIELFKGSEPQGRRDGVVVVCDPDGEWTINQRGWIDVPIIVANLVEGEVDEATGGVVRRLVHREDLLPAQSARTAAFIKAWLKTWRLYLGCHTDPVGQAPERHIRNSATIENPELDSFEGFAKAMWEERQAHDHFVDSRAWRQPDRGRRYPDLDKKVSCVAADLAWEQEVRDGKRDLDEYAQWLLENKDPCGEMHRVFADTGELARRRQTRFMDKHRRYMRGPFTCRRWNEVAFEGANGWIEEATFCFSFDPGGPELEAVVSAVYSLPRARFLSRMTCQGWRDLTRRYAPKDESPEITLLANIFGNSVGIDVPDSWSAYLPPHPHLRELTLYVHPEMLPFDDEERQRLHTLFPSLETLNVHEGVANAPNETFF